jgi:hypothetical protein
LIGWAVMRFRAETAPAPMVVWGILGMLMLNADYRGEIDISEQGRAELIEQFMGACVEKYGIVNPEMGITERQIGALGLPRFRGEVSSWD